MESIQHDDHLCNHWGRLATIIIIIRWRLANAHHHRHGKFRSCCCYFCNSARVEGEGGGGGAGHEIITTSALVSRVNAAAAHKGNSSFFGIIISAHAPLGPTWTCSNNEWGCAVPYRTLEGWSLTALLLMQCMGCDATITTTITTTASAEPIWCMGEMLMRVNVAWPRPPQISLILTRF